MYTVPGYVTYEVKKGAIYITSGLYRNTVRLTDFALQKEFETIVYCGGCTELNTPLTNFLHEQDLLLNEEEIDRELNKVKSVLDDIFMVTLMPTEGCNFRCPYCYEDHNRGGMTRDTLDRIKEYIAAQAPHYKQVVLAWFGGEPTLCKDTVLEVSELVQNLQKQCGFQYAANMTTNGYLLDEKLFRQFYQAGITSYQITLDGWDHDKTRPHVSGKGTLQTIIENLMELSKLSPEEYPFHITLRHNILAGDEDYTWYDHLHRLFGQDKRFDILVRAVGDWGGETVRTLSLLYQDTADTLIAKHVSYLDKIGMPCQNHQTGLFSQVCYASYPHSVVFRADGRIGKCTVALDHPKNQLGWVDPERGVVINTEMKRRWNISDLKPECRSCQNVLSCMNMRCKKSEIIDGNKLCYYKKAECAQSSN